jgi:hypothetical protein
MPVSVSSCSQGESFSSHEKAASEPSAGYRDILIIFDK